MRALVAPTDYGWYRFLQARPELREVNFWRPSQRAVNAIAPGELFFFKLKAPYNAIAGFGIFTRAAVLPSGKPGTYSDQQTARRTWRS